MTSVALPAKVNPNVDATFEDALFMVVVRSKDSEDASDTLPTFQAVMPADSVVACDARGGLAARRPSSVQLLTRDPFRAQSRLQLGRVLLGDDLLGLAGEDLFSFLVG